MAARSALAKLTARVPASQRHRLEHAVLDAQRYISPPKPTISAGALRKAAWDERAVRFDYTDMSGAQTHRTVWPLAIVYLEASSVLLAWCLLRNDFRTFRLDRMAALDVLTDSFRPRRAGLLREHIDRLRQTDQVSRSTHPPRNGNAVY
jgi:predicted DNA-binding transcriptional regulator YafY